MIACACLPFALNIDCPVHGEAARQLLVEAIDNNRLIQAQPPGRCELCGAVKETRPYGPNGEQVCFDCGMKDEEAAKRHFGARIGVAPSSDQQATPDEPGKGER